MSCIHCESKNYLKNRFTSYGNVFDDKSPVVQLATSTSYKQKLTKIWIKKDDCEPDSGSQNKSGKTLKLLREL